MNVTVSALASLTANVACPLASEIPTIVVTVAFGELAVRYTTSPTIAAPVPSFRATVIVEVDAPSSSTVELLDTTVEDEPDTIGPGAKTTAAVDAMTKGPSAPVAVAV